MSLSSTTSLNMETDSVTSNGKKSLKEGSVQMTSLSTLLSFHRYFFLYHDTLILSKQKGSGSFKLKDKLCLSKVWIASSNTIDSFLIGWPLANYLVHFRSQEEKDEWFELISCCIQSCLKPLFTTISMDINVRGRKQVIRRRVENGKKSGELVVETAADLGLSNTSYELKLTIGENSGKTLQGPENVYAVIMHEIEKSGLRLSESQKQCLDTCPIANARLVLSTMKSTKTPTPMQIVNIIKKRVMQKTESRGVLGRGLDAATPPQTIMTIVDHLRMDGFDAEGIFRKSPKQSTFKELRQELQKGLVPDYSKYSTHVLASMLKEYLRSIPGKILQSGNYDLWMKEVVDETDEQRKLTAARTLLSLLPTSHSILLANVLKLLSKIASSPSSKMTSSALSVCLGPSFLESSDPMEGGKKIPLLVQFLIENAPTVVPGFNSDSVFSILTTVDHNSNVLCSPSNSDDDSSQRTPIIEELRDDDVLSQSSLAESSSVNSEPLDQTPIEELVCESAVKALKNGHEPPLCFSSDSEGELEEEGGKLNNRDTFLAKAPVFDHGDGGLQEQFKEDKPNVVSKVEEKRETPRSPCLKRIHFQRTEAQLRSNEMFKYDSRAELDFTKQGKLSEREKANEEVPLRKESREEATQTGDEMGVEERQRFPAFRSSSAVIEQVSSVPASPCFSRRELLDKMYRSRDPARPKQDEKPIVQVHPFNQLTSLQSITDRLTQLRERQKEQDESSRFNRKVQPAELLVSPSLKPFSATSVHQIQTAKATSEQTARTAASLYPSYEPPTLITEKFQPYCIEPEEQNFSKRVELHRSSSQRGEKSPCTVQKELQRAYSVKAARRGPIDSCVGMDPLEINWSVRHLKTLFQDKRAPTIDTQYNNNNNNNNKDRKSIGQ